MSEIKAGDKEMRDIKVGDRVAVYQIIDCGLIMTFRQELRPFRFVGIVTNIWRDHKDLIGVKILSSDPSDQKLKGIKVINCHSMQCRKLVKVKKCDKCKGTGKIWPQEICEKCNGKGKVKK